MKFYRTRSRLRASRRLLFPSPAEMQLLRVMGGRVITVDLLHDPATGFALSFVVSMGSVFKKEQMRREVRAGKCWIDFGNDIKRGVEVDGAAYHGDIIREHNRDDYCARFGWRLLHIPASMIYGQPELVRKKVLTFLTE